MPYNKRLRIQKGLSRACRDRKYREMRIIIVGCGKVGGTLAAQLAEEGHDITVVDRAARCVSALTEQYDINGAVGNGATVKTLSEAGVKGADLVVAATAHDEVNIICCLIAKKVGNCHTIARVRDPQYAAEIGLLKEELGLSMTINPELAAAREISRLIRMPSAMKIDTFAKGRVELLQLRVPPASRLDGLAICEVGPLVSPHVLICMVERGGEVTIPDGRFVLAGDDLITVIIPPRDAFSFFRKAGVATSRINSALIIGGGKMGFFLAGMLLDAGISVKIVEQDANRCEFLSEKLPGVTVIHGDGTDRDLLREEGLASAGCFCALTGIDEENIMLSLYAGTQSKAKRITKVNRITFEEVIAALPLGSVVYPKEITTGLIMQYVRAMQNTVGSNVETMHRLHGAEALEFRVRGASRVTGVPLEKLSLKPGLLVCCINRGGKIITPRGKDTIEPGDTVIIVTATQGLGDLTDILSE